MHDINKLFKSCNIELAINLPEWLETRFYFIHHLDPKFLDQMTSQEICESDYFFNHDTMKPFIYLLENNKVTEWGFRSIIRSDLTAIEDGDSKKLFDELMRYIDENNVELDVLFGTKYLAQNLGRILSSHDFDIDILHRNLNLEKVITDENFSVATLIFNLRLYDEEHNEKVINYIIENWELISGAFLTHNLYGVRNIFRNCLDSFEKIYSDPLIVVLNELYKRYGFESKFFENQTLITFLIEDEIKHSIESAINMINEIKDVDLHDSFYKHNNQIIDYVNSIDLEKLNYLDIETVEEYQAFIKKVSDPVLLREVTSNMDIHRKINSNGAVNWDFKKYVYSYQYTEEFVNFYFDIAYNAYNEKNVAITKHYKFLSFYQELAWMIMNLVKQGQGQTWQKELFKKMLECDLFHDTIVNYTQDNGFYHIVALIVEYNPEFLKSKFDTALLFDNVLIKHNMNNQGW